MTDTSLADLKKLLGLDEDATGRASTADVLFSRMRLMGELKEFVISNIKARNFNITGDDTHLSVRDILETAAKIDEKPKYDFQNKDDRLNELIRQFNYLYPDSFMGAAYDVADIKAAIAGERPIVLNPSPFTNQGCYDCKKPLRLTLNGTHIHIDAAEPCENNSSFSVEIDFPTGEVVFDDWPAYFSELRAAGYIDEGDDAESINYVRGQRKRSEAYAAQGIYHLSVGNSCPTWYVNEATNEILIGGGAYDDDTDETIDPEGYTNKGSFCTDLWWVTMLDKSRYDEMVSKVTKSKKKVKVNTATIKPGRYRFSAIPCVGEDYDASGRIYAKAQYLGPCGEIPKVQNISESKVLLNPRQCAIHTAMKYPNAFGGPYDVARFRLADQIFNVLGSGIHSKGEFLAFISVSPNTVIPDEMPTDEDGEFTEADLVEERNPYPNFKKEHSLVWEMKLKDFPTEWVEEAVWFYTKCQQYFNSDSAVNYAYAYNPAKGPSVSWVEILEKRKARAKSEAAFQKEWTKDYQLPFSGDLSEWLQAKWNVQLEGIHSFIAETIALLSKELTRRNKAKKA